jgi:hypothetical protein
MKTFYFLSLSLLIVLCHQSVAQIKGKTWVGLGPTFESNGGTYGFAGQVERSWQVGVRNSVGIGFFGYHSVIIQDDRHRNIPNKREYVSLLALEPYAKFPLYGPERRGGMYVLGGPMLMDEFGQMIVYSQRDNQGNIVDWRYEYDDAPLWLGLRLGTGYEWKTSVRNLCRIELGVRSNRRITEPMCVNFNFLYGF